MSTQLSLRYVKEVPRETFGNRGSLNSAMAKSDPSGRLRKPDHVVMRELEGEAVLLDLETEVYFGLDEVGTRVWTELVASGSVEAACGALQREFEVAPAVLRRDVEQLTRRLLETGLLELDADGER